jgi:hypothetical protein
MGWDISYHPISEQQIIRWYFDVLENQNLIQQLANENNIEDFYADKYRETIEVALSTAPSDAFDKTHGYYIAVIQGFFDTFYYVRGSALSFSETGNLTRYFKQWEQIVPAGKLKNKVHNQIIENYCSGVFIPPAQVVQLLNDYHTDAAVKAELDELFSHKRLNVFMRALEHARERGLGLLEATEVMEPNPMNLNESACYSNLFNCDKEGPLLYREAALEQFAQLEKREELESGSIAAKAEYTRVNVNPNEKGEKKSFWKKLFGR